MFPNAHMKCILMSAARERKEPEFPMKTSYAGQRHRSASLDSVGGMRLVLEHRYERSENEVTGRRQAAHGH